MRIRAAASLLAIGVLLVSCGPQATEPSSSTTEQTFSEVTTTFAMTTTGESTSTSEQSGTGADVESYLVEMSNLAADVESELGDFECSYNEQFWPGFCSGEFVEEGEEFEPPPQPSEEEMFAIQQGLWLGMFDIRLAHADVLGAVPAPPGFEEAHQKYVDSYRAYFDLLRDQVAGFVEPDELFEFLNAIFDPLTPLSPELETLLLGMVDSCRSLEDLASDAGYRADLACPEPPPEAETVAVEVGDEWSATPNPLPVGDGLVQMTITNTGNSNLRPVVIHIFSGDPLDLPFVDGVLDISRDGVFEPGSGFAEFALAYPGHEVVFTEGDSKVTGEVPDLAPGQSIEVVVWSEESIVVLDYGADEFENGAYVVVERSG